MGCRIIEDREDHYSALYCSTTMTAFGPVMPNREVAEAFIQWMPNDPRHCGSRELRDKYDEFVMQFVCECGEVRCIDCQECKDEWPLQDGIHYGEDGETASCDKDPAPAKGERFSCRHCREAEARKNTKTEKPTCKSRCR